MALWICVSTFLVSLGWLLSICHALNATGYGVSFGVAAIAVVIWKKRVSTSFFPPFKPAKLRKRFRRNLPMMFLALAALVLLGGLLHPPSNFDGISYRTPRVLHWLAAEHWHWIHTHYPRLNVRATGFEWFTAPIIALMKTDRALFLVNVVSFLLLPGLVFSVLRRLGVRRKVAWHWMWILPTGYTYLLQAGSIGNDLFGTVFALAAIDFALRARESRRISDVWLSLLAAALVTEAKSSNLIVGISWLAAIWPTLALVRFHVGRSLVVGGLAVLVSVIPNSWLNIRYCGDWSGKILEHPAFGGDALFRFPVNLASFTLQNFAPPVFPFAKQWQTWVQRVIPSELAEKLASRFEAGAARFRLGEMQTEEAAGLGFGVCSLVVVSFGLAWWTKKRLGLKSPRLQSHQTLVSAGAWMAIAIFMSQNGLSGAVRYLAPFNVLAVAPFLLGLGQVAVVRSRIWKIMVGVVFGLAALLLIINPARPLWPAVTVLRSMGAEQSPSQLIQRAWAVYSVYSQRSDGFAPVRRILPVSADPLGFITFDDPETSLWRPFGSRRIIHVIQADTAEELRAKGIKYVLVNGAVLTERWQTTLDDWLKAVAGETVWDGSLNFRVSIGAQNWYLVQLR